MPCALVDEEMDRPNGVLRALKKPWLYGGPAFLRSFLDETCPIRMIIMPHPDDNHEVY